MQTSITVIDALENAKLPGAVLDVTEIELLPKDSKLWQFTNVILNQHPGVAHKLRVQDIVAKFADNIRKFLENKKR